MSLVVETRDASSTLALLADLRGVARIRPHGQRCEMRLVHSTIGAVGIDLVTLGMDFDADVNPAGMLVFGQVNSGAVGFRTEGTERRHTEGDVYLAGQPNHGRATMVRAGEHEQAIIDPALPSQVADTEPGRAQQPVQFTGYLPVSAEAALAWKRTYAFIRDAILASPETVTQPLFTASASRLLVATALNTFPNNALTAPTVEDRHDAHPETLRRAVAFIDDHAHTGITIADVAAAAHVTIRAVQLAFRRHLDITPMEYLRRVRLDHAHRDLIVADPAHETVTAVAYRWGFASPSRFAVFYRQAYGVTPRYTLHGG